LLIIFDWYGDFGKGLEERGLSQCVNGEEGGFEEIIKANNDDHLTKLKYWKLESQIPYSKSSFFFSDTLFECTMAHRARR
jgi:hypothetical protein